MVFWYVFLFAVKYNKSIKYGFVYEPEQVISIPDLGFEDDSNVFIANYISGYIIPDQNPKANYIAMVIPKRIKKGHFGYNELTCKNMYYLSDYLEKLDMEKFSENKPAYVVFSFHGLALGKDKHFYEDAIKYYSKGEIKLNFNNCKTVPLNVTGYFNLYPGPVYVCKLK